MTVRDQNPYASPTPETAPGVSDSTQDFRMLACQIILAWEKLRIAYLIWLSLVFLGVLALTVIDVNELLDSRFWFVLIFGFLGANLCFTVGHVSEISLAALDMPEGPRRRLRGVVFVLGTLFATALTLASSLAVASGDF